MAKFNISFNGAEYNIDESALTNATNELKSHLSTVMNGEGATISLGGVSYGVDSAKLSSATTDFVSHLGTIAGSGSKVVIGGVEYSVDSSKVAGAVSALEGVLDGLNAGGGDTSFAAGLYQTGAIALYNEQGAEAIEGMMVKSWDELLANNYLVLDDGVLYAGCIAPDNLPEKNEYGFYYDVLYQTYDSYGFMFHADGSFEKYDGGEICESMPAGSVTYSNNTIDMSDYGYWELPVCNDGLEIDFDGEAMSVGSPANLAGDLLVPNDGSITAFGTFDDDSGIGIVAFYLHDELTGITIPDNMTVINARAFSYCANITNIDIPNGVTNIGAAAFSGTGASNLYIPDSVMIIGHHAFSKMNNLQSVSFGENCQLTTISVGAFSGCSNLTEIALPDSLIVIDRYAFNYCPKLKTITIPNGVTSIKFQAFADSGLTSVTIPSSVVTIDSGAFLRCYNLTSIIFEGTMAQWNAIDKAVDWRGEVPATYVQCSDGQVAL